MNSLLGFIKSIEIIIFLNCILTLGFHFVLGNRVSYIIPQEHVSHTIKPNEIYFHFFFSKAEVETFFNFYSIKGKSMIYAHYDTKGLI